MENLEKDLQEKIKEINSHKLNLTNKMSEFSQEINKKNQIILELENKIKELKDTLS